MSNRITDMIPTTAAKGDCRGGKSKRACRKRLTLSWAAAVDAADDLLQAIDDAITAGALSPDDAAEAWRRVVGVSEELLSTRPRLTAAR